MREINVWAHRGASGYAPENTLRAFLLAAEMGADGVELDVQMTRDGKLAVVHDERIDRVSDGSGLVKDYTLEELKRFCFNKTHPEYEGAKLPALEEVYELLKPLGLRVNVELKTGVIWYPGIEEAVVKLTHDMGMEDRVLYSSFNHLSIARIKELDPQAKTAILFVDVLADTVGYAKRIGVDALHPGVWFQDMGNLMKQWIDSSLEVNVWTVNEETDMRRLMEAGVNGVITNYPDRALNVRKNCGSVSYKIK